MLYGGPAPNTTLLLNKAHIYTYSKNLASTHPLFTTESHKVSQERQYCLWALFLSPGGGGGWPWSWGAQNGLSMSGAPIGRKTWSRGPVQVSLCWRRNEGVAALLNLDQLGGCRGGQGTKPKAGVW